MIVLRILGFILKIIWFVLKLIGWILLTLLLVLLAALCVPVGLTVRYEPEVTFRVRWLFWTFYIAGEKTPEKPPGVLRRALAAVGRFLLTVFKAVGKALSAVFRGIKKGFAWLKRRLRRKPRPRKKKKPAPPKEPEKKQSFIGALVEQRGVLGMIGFFADIGKAMGGAMVRIYRGVRIDRLVLHVSVSGEDASDTAVKYGKICAGAFPALSFLLSNTRGYDPASPRTNDIEITPDFAGEGIRVYLIGEFTVFPIAVVGHLLAAVIRFGIAQLRLTSKRKKNENDEK